MRYCTKCGKELNEGVAYCPHCGAEQKVKTDTSNEMKIERVSPATKTRAKGANKKVIAIVIGVVVVVVVLAIILFVLLFKGKSENNEKNMTSNSVTSNNVTSNNSANSNTSKAGNTTNNSTSGQGVDYNKVLTKVFANPSNTFRVVYPEGFSYIEGEDAYGVGEVGRAQLGNSKGANVFVTYQEFLTITPSDYLNEYKRKYSKKTYNEKIEGNTLSFNDIDDYGNNVFCYYLIKNNTVYGYKFSYEYSPEYEALETCIKECADAGELIRVF